jgi:hypothetical protein
MVSAGVVKSDDQAAMMTHLKDISEPAKIKQKIDGILFQLKLGKYQEGGDPSPGNHMRQDPRPVSHVQLGRDLFHRIKKKR